jgi:hypothetical protein
MPPADVSVAPEGKSGEVLPGSVGMLAPPFGDAAPVRARPAERVLTEIELGAKPAADRSRSNPEPARLSPPTDDKADRTGADAERLVVLLSVELGAPLLDE